MKEKKKGKNITKTSFMDTSRGLALRVQEAVDMTTSEAQNVVLAAGQGKKNTNQGVRSERRID